MERVQKIIAAAGICSRRKAEDLIKDGKVKVNGKTITIGDQAEPTDSVSVNEKELIREKTKYYILNKPKAYITTSDDMFGRKKVLDLVPNKPRVFSVGRLDRDATGLILLTNDGTFANNIMHPSKEIAKTYLATLDKPFFEKQVKRLADGVQIDKSWVRAKAIIIDEKTVAITLHVGINKVVKRLFKALDYYVQNLHRTHIGNLELDVATGTYRELTELDKKLVFEKPKITKERILKLIKG